MTFTIRGIPCGYYAQAGRNKWRMSKEQRARAEKYREWQDWVAKEYVLARSSSAAYATGIVAPRLPLSSYETAPIIVKTRCYFRTRVHPDPENVHKGIVDALFRHSDTSDKYVGGAFTPPQYDPKDPRVEVEISGLLSEVEEMKRAGD